MGFKKIIKSKQNILVILIMFLAIIVRIIDWPNGINDVNCDEAMMAINARSIAETGRDIYGTKLPIYFEAWLNAGQSALPTYLVALFIKMFGFTLFSIRLPILLISLISIYIVYLLSKKIFNQEVAIINLFLTAINPWHIMQSQWNLDCNFFPHIVLIAICCLYIGTTENKKKYTYISMVFFGLSMYCYGVSVYFVTIFLLIVGLYLLVNKRIDIKDFFISMLIYIIISIPIFIMYIINFLNLDTINLFGLTIQKFNYDTRSNDMLIFSTNILSQLKMNIISLLEVIILQRDGLIWNAIEGFGTIYLLSIIFIFIAIVRVYKEQNRNLYILSVWLGISLFIGILINATNINRLNIIWYPMIMLTGYGIYAACQFTNHKKIVKSIIISLYILYFILFCLAFFGSFKDKISNSITFSKGLVAACKFINNSNNQEIIISEKANTRGHYVYYRYALEYDYTQNVKREELLSYYAGNNKEVSWFNNDKKIYFTENFDKEKKIEETIYLITYKEKDNVKNIEEYIENRFGDYIVLVKK